MVLMCQQAESRQDEEQNVKLDETIDLLLAAGYFRARIKGLSPFDKVYMYFISGRHILHIRYMCT